MRLCVKFLLQKSVFNLWLNSCRSRFQTWLIVALLLLVTIAPYWPATQCDFVNYDDSDFVTANLHIQGGLSWEGVKWAFSNTEQAAYWAPLMWLSHMLAWQLFGSNPWGHHLINVLLHATNTALVFLLFRRMTGATWRSLMVAALFGLHPVHVESVVWVTERKDVLSACFGLLTLFFYARYAQKVASGEFPHPASGSRPSSPSPSVKSVLSVAKNPCSCEADVRLQSVATHSALDYGLALFFFACGLMSKAMLVTWPFVMLLLDYWPLRRFQLSASVPSVAKNPGLWRLVFEKIPFFALAVAASVVTFVVQKHGGAVAAGGSLPFGARVANALISYCRYLRKMFWPTDLAIFYPHPGHWPMWEVLLVGVVLLGISVLLIAQRRRYPFLLMGWLWYCGTLLPVIGLVQSSMQAMADRFTYLPSLGVLILAIWGAYELTRRWRYHVIALSVMGSAAIILCLGLTRQQIGYWQDSESLFRHALEVTEGNYLAHNNLGNTFLEKGQIDQAIRQFQEAILLQPGYADAHNSLGDAFEKQGQTDQAIRQFQEAIRLRPGDAKAHYNLGTVLDMKGQTDEAIRQFQEAVRLQPDYAEARNNFGNTLGRKGQIDEAIRQFQEAIRLKPDVAEVRYNLGVALFAKGQIDEAIRQFRETIRLKPDHAAAHDNLGVALLKNGKSDEAIIQFQEAIRLKPDVADAHNNLGTALGMKGRTGEAIVQFREAVRLKPDDANARNNLAVALGRKGQTD